MRELVLRAKDGDDGAFGELIRLHEAAVFRLALSITRSRAEAEDAAQEAFLRAYRALDRFDPERSFRPWILKIAANRAKTKVTRRKREAPLDEEPLKDSEKTMEQILGRDLEADSLRGTMAALAADDRAILHLRYDEDMRLAEIARTLGIREGAAKVRLFRARERLMKLLEGKV